MDKLFQTFFAWNYCLALKGDVQAKNQLRKGAYARAFVPSDKGVDVFVEEWTEKHDNVPYFTPLFFIGPPKSADNRFFFFDFITASAYAASIGEKRVTKTRLVTFSDNTKQSWKM